MVDSRRALPPINVLAIEDVSNLRASLEPNCKYFTLMLAWDLQDSNDPNVREIFRQLVSQGLVYLCAWGLNCEAVHDAADEVCVELGVAMGDSDYLLMTTWHKGDTLEEAFEFFANLAVPSEPDVFSDFERYVVTVGNPEWATTIRGLNSRLESRLG